MFIRECSKTLMSQWENPHMERERERKNPCRNIAVGCHTLILYAYTNIFMCKLKEFEAGNRNKKIRRKADKKHREV